MDKQTDTEQGISKRHPLRIIAIVFLIILALYSLLLSFVAPLLIKHYAFKSVNEYTHWNLVLNDVRIDPFDLSIEVDHLNLLSPENENEIGFSSFLIDIEASDTLYNLFFEQKLKPVIKTVSLSAPFTHIEISKNGSLALNERIKPLPENQEEPEEEISNDGKEIEWLVQEIIIDSGRVIYKDMQPATFFKTEVSGLSARLENLNNDLSTLLPFSLSLQLDQAPVVLKGDLSIAPFSTNGQLSLDHLSLNKLQPYIAEYSNVKLTEGLLSLKSDFDLKQNNQLEGIITSSLKLDSLSTQSLDTEQPLFGLNHLSIGPVKVQLEPMLIDVADISLDKPKVFVSIDEQKRLNFASLAAQKSDSEIAAETTNAQTSSSTESAELSAPEQVKTENAVEEKEVAVVQQETSESSAPTISLKSFTINSGHIDIIDQSISPHFSNSIEELNLSITDYSQDTATLFTLDTGLLNTGSLKANGRIISPGKSPDSELALSLTHIDLNHFSAYSEHFVGYPIDGGTLNFDTNYLIESEQLVASHEIFVDKLEFKKKSNKDPVVSAPLPLVVGILEDKDQLIELNVPAKGDLSDPEVDVVSLVVNAFTRFFTKIITSPFSMLGKVLGIEEDISRVIFEPGQTDLNASQSRLLTKLATALNSRPKLRLNISCHADRASDRLALAQAKQTAINSQNANNTSSTQAQEASSDKTSEQTIEANRNTLPPVEETELLALAVKRGEHIQDYMLAIAKLPDNRLTLSEERIIEESDQETKHPTACEFQLN